MSAAGRSRLAWLGSLLGWALLACSTARPLKPLAPGSFALEASVPAAWVQIGGFAFPVGTLVLGARYGLRADTELRWTLYPLTLAEGVVGFDSGAIWHALPALGWAPALHLSGELSALAAPDQFDRGLRHAIRGAVDLSATAHWEPLPWLYPYVVLENVIVLKDGRYVGSLGVGGQLLITAAWSLDLETGWAAFNTATDRYTQPYVGFANQGAIWLAWSVTYRGGFLEAGTPAPQGEEP